MARVVGMDQGDLNPPVEGTMVRDALDGHSVPDESITGLGGLATQAEQPSFDDDTAESLVPDERNTAENPVTQVHGSENFEQEDESNDDDANVASQDGELPVGDPTDLQFREVQKFVEVGVPLDLINFISSANLRFTNRDMSRPTTTPESMEAALKEKAEVETLAESNREYIEVELPVELEERLVDTSSAIAEDLLTNDKEVSVLEDGRFRHPRADLMRAGHRKRVCGLLEDAAGANEDLFNAYYRNDEELRELVDTARAEYEDRIRKAEYTPLIKTPYMLRMDELVVQKYASKLVESMIRRQRLTVISRHSADEHAAEIEDVVDRKQGIGAAVSRRYRSYKDKPKTTTTEESGIAAASPVENVLEQHDYIPIDVRRSQLKAEKVAAVKKKTDILDEAVQDVDDFVQATKAYVLSPLGTESDSMDPNKFYIFDTMREATLDTLGQYGGDKTNVFEMTDPYLNSGDTSSERVPIFVRGFAGGINPKTGETDLPTTLIESCETFGTYVPPLENTDPETNESHSRVHFFGLLRKDIKQQRFVGPAIIELRMDYNGSDLSATQEVLYEVEISRVSLHENEDIHAFWGETLAAYGLTPVNNEIPVLTRGVQRIIQKVVPAKMQTQQAKLVAHAKKGKTGAPEMEELDVERLAIDV